MTNTSQQPSLAASRGAAFVASAVCGCSVNIAALQSGSVENKTCTVVGNQERRNKVASIYATTDNESQAASIALRLIEEDHNATTRDVTDLVAEGFPIRSSYRYAVIILK